MHADDTQPTRPQGQDAPRPAPTPGPRPGDDLQGQVLGGKYRVVRLLGKGGFGAVYEAKDEILGASVAIKVLTTEAAEQDDALQQFLGEARLLTSLDHPNVVRWITFDRTASGLHYFVMEFLEGTELSDVLKREQRLEPRRAVQMLLQVLSALRAAHFLPDGRSLLHLDLKPQNVFVVRGEPEVIKVIDFGISQHVGAAARTAAGVTPGGRSSARADLGATIATVPAASDREWMVSANGVTRARGGTLLYASPEQCKHLRGDAVIDELDGRSDLYSLGVMAYQMLAGKTPWAVRTPTEAFQAHLEVPAPRLSKLGVKLPRGLDAFLERCLAKDRDDRFADVKEAYQALQRIATPPARWPLVVAAAALVAAFVVWWSWPEQRRAEVALANVDGTLFLGPANASITTPVTRLEPTLYDAPVDWVTDPGSGAPTTLPGWTTTLELVDGAPQLRLAAPTDGAAFDGTLYPRFGAGGAAQFGPAVRLVYLPPDACAVQEASVPGAGSRVVDPVGAALQVLVRAAEATFVDAVEVALDATTRRLRADPTRAGDGLFAYTLPLTELVDPATEPRTLDLAVTVRDRAGNAQAARLAVQVDGRPLAFRPELVGCITEGADSYILYPSSTPTLQWRGNRSVDVTLAAYDVGPPERLVEFGRENRPDGGIALQPPEAAGSYAGRLEIKAVDSRSTHHLDPGRGQRTHVLRFRYETRPVALAVTPNAPDGTALRPASAEATFVTGAANATLSLARELVQVTVTVACRHGGETVFDTEIALHRNAADEVTLALPEPGVYELELAAYRHAGAQQRPQEPEFVQRLTLVRDTAAPTLQIVDEPPDLTREQAPDGDACFAVELGDDGSEPLQLDWWIEGPSAHHGTATLPPGAARREALTWASCGLDHAALADGSYRLAVQAADAAGNRSPRRESAPFLVARRGPELKLLTPRDGQWLAVSGNTFQVVVRAEDANEVAAVECLLEDAAGGEPTAAVTLAPTADDRVAGDWVGQIALPSTWSERRVRLRLRGEDRHGNRAAELVRVTELQAFEVSRPQRVWLQVAGAEATPMVLVRGDANYLAGRMDQRDIDALLDLGIDARQREPADAQVVADFYLDENEVTVAQFAAFVAAEDGYLEARHWQATDGAGRSGTPRRDRHAELVAALAATAPDLPVTGVDWYEAAACAHWLGKRLPTKVEWEYTVRGGTAYRVFTGDASGGDPVAGLNVARNGRRGAPGAWPVTPTADVTPKGVAEGVRNLCSNVAEWTTSVGPRRDTMQAAGGHFEHTHYHFAIMTPLAPTTRRATVGFRCAIPAADVDTLQESPGTTRVSLQPPSSAPENR